MMLWGIGFSKKISKGNSDSVSLMTEEYIVIPAKAGIQTRSLKLNLDSRFRGNDIKDLIRDP